MSHIGHNTTGRCPGLCAFAPLGRFDRLRIIILIYVLTEIDNSLFEYSALKILLLGLGFRICNSNIKEKANLQKVGCVIRAGFKPATF